MPGDEFPCRVNALPRTIPARTWFTHPLSIVALTGVLPFGAVFIEIFFIFSSIWSHKFYYVWGFLLLVVLILIVVSVCVTVVAVYFQLNSEDWRWPWTSFVASASTAAYVFLYGVYYFYFKTSMTGFFQTTFYFCYLGLFCTALGLMCGGIGFLGALVFVRRIFRNIKVD
jgi:transmembrane 9 superfamily protein 3